MLLSLCLKIERTTMPESKPTKHRQLLFKELIKCLPPREKESYKGDYGHTLLVGGDSGFSGAIRLASEAALRVGSGLVSVATRAEHTVSLTMSRPEVMCHGVSEQSSLRNLMQKCQVIGLGPGLGQTAWSHCLYSGAMESGLPMVVDADALNLLAKMPEKRANWVLTPHVGEAARLLNCSTADVQWDRQAAVRKLQHEYGGVVVLKGVGSLIFDGAGDIYQCKAGNPGMASGGMGDVLTGIISGLIAQGLTCLEAATLGVVVHAMAGDRAARSGERGMVASDLMQAIRELVNDY